MKIARSTKTLPITGAWGWGKEPHPTHPSDLNPGVLDAFLIEIPWKSSSQHVPYQINVSENQLKINDLFRTTTTCIFCFVVLNTQPEKPGSIWLHVHVYVLQKGFPVLCDYLINCLLLYVSFVASNIQVGFQHLALFFREQIRQFG